MADSNLMKEVQETLAAHESGAKGAVQSAERLLSLFETLDWAYKQSTPPNMLGLDALNRDEMGGWSWRRIRP